MFLDVLQAGMGSPRMFVVGSGEKLGCEWSGGAPVGRTGGWQVLVSLETRDGAAPAGQVEGAVPERVRGSDALQSYLGWKLETRARLGGGPWWNAGACHCEVLAEALETVVDFDDGVLHASLMVSAAASASAALPQGQYVVMMSL